MLRVDPVLPGVMGVPGVPVLGGACGGGARPDAGGGGVPSIASLLSDGAGALAGGGGGEAVDAAAGTVQVRTS